MEQPYVLRGEVGSMLTDTGAAAQPADLIKDATTQSFMKDVIEESRRQPVLVEVLDGRALGAQATRERENAPFRGLVHPA